MKALRLGLSLVGGPRLVDTGATNLITQPQAFDNAYWLKSGTDTISANAVQAPDGTTTADKYIPSTTNAAHTTQAAAGGNIVPTGVDTVSIYAKYAGYPRIAFRIFDGTAYRIRTTFDIQAGSVVLQEAGTGSITPLPNGWFFCQVVSDTMLATGGYGIDILDGTHTAQGSFAGDGTSGVYLWQAQCVAGSSPGPIIYR